MSYRDTDPAEVGFARVSGTHLCKRVLHECCTSVAPARQAVVYTGQVTPAKGKADDVRDGDVSMLAMCVLFVFFVSTYQHSANPVSVLMHLCECCTSVAPVPSGSTG